jgi:hypothetical protein
MVLAGGAIFAAGPEDLLDEEDAVRQLDAPATQAKILEAEAAWAGANGALLWAVSAADGAKKSEVRLESPPVFDGMAAAGGRLYIAQMDGSVVCLGGE